MYKLDKRIFRQETEQGLDRAGKTRKDLWTHLGISERNFYYYISLKPEDKDKFPPLDVFLKWCEFIETSPIRLITGEGAAQETPQIREDLIKYTKTLTNPNKPAYLFLAKAIEKMDYKDVESLLLILELLEGRKNVEFDLP